MNEIVKYENQLNATPLRNFKAVDLDFLMLLCHKFRDEGTRIIKFDLAEIRNLAHYKFTGQDRLVKDLVAMNKKLLNCDFLLRTENKIVQFVLFTRFEIDENENTLEVKVNEEFSFLLNNLERNFTRFELDEFISLKSSYAKECYRRLKQFRTTGIWIVTIDEFRVLLDVPSSYKMGDFDRAVLKPIQEELTPLFKNLSITKQYKRGRGRGGKVVHGLEFRFQPEKVESIDHTAKKPSESKIKHTGLICCYCGKPLYETTLNGANCWCHNFNIQGDECKAIFNSVAEIKGYDEQPTREKTEEKVTAEEIKAMIEQLKKK